MVSDQACLAAVKARLYALPPDEFVEARNAEAARAGGPLARQILALRRPTLAAWLVNLLAAHRGRQLGELLTIGERLRDAQRSLEGQELRELSTRGQLVITSLVGMARDLAADHGRNVRDETVWEAETTLRAALADPALAAEIRAGCLVKAAEYSGLGLAPSEPSGTRPVPTGPVPATPRQRRAKLRVIPGGRESRRATVPDTAPTLPTTPHPNNRERRRAEAALAKAERELDQATSAERTASQRLAEIAAELDRLRLRERRLRTEQSETERDRRRAERRRRAAEQSVAESRRRMG